MMKLVVTLLCLVAVTQANYTTTQLQKLHSAFVNCTAVLGVPEDTVHYEKHGMSGDLLLKDPLFKKELLCIMEGMGMITETGSLILPKMKEFLREGHDEKTLEKMLEQCSKVEMGAPPVEKVYQYYRCFWTQDTFVM